MAEDVAVTIDGVSLKVPKGTLLVEAAKRIQLEIPVYCYHEKLGPAGLCRVCLVEIEGMPKLQIACNTTVYEGMVVNTLNERVTDGRRAILELFLLNHPLDCPICDKGGECDLQDYVVSYGQGASRMAEAKESKPKAVDLGPTIVLDEERCIVCQRCVRFEEIISHERSLVVKDRGAHDIIATASETPYHSDFSGNVTELCPVGALTSKSYRFLSRPWDNHRTASSCAQCSQGCAINIDVRNGAIARTMSVPDDAVSDGWLCDRGRYNIGFINAGERLRSPLIRQGKDLVQISWDQAIMLWAKAIRDTDDAQRIATLGGARLTNEEAYLTQYLMRALGSNNLDWRTGRQRQAAPGRYAGTLEELEQSEAIIIAGIGPAQTAPVFDLRIRKAVTRNRAKLYSIGASGAGSFVPEQRVIHLHDIRNELFDTVQRIALVWDGIDIVRGRELAVLANELTDAGKTVRTYIAGSAPNAAGAEAMGLHPRYRPHYEAVSGIGLESEAIFAAAGEGRISVLHILGANPILTAVDPRLVKAALLRVPFVVVSELFMTQTTEYATLVLPAASAFERSGHFTNLQGLVRPIEAALPIPEGILTDGEMIIALADALQIELPNSEQTYAAAVRNVDAVRMSSFQLGDEHLYGTQSNLREADPNALSVAIAQASFAGSGTLAHDERISALRSSPGAVFSPQTAAQHSLLAGCIIDLRGSNGAAVANLVVRIDPAVAPNRVVILDGLAQAPANVLIDGETVQVENVRGERPLVGASA